MVQLRKTAVHRQRISKSILFSYLAMLIVPAVLGGILYSVALRNSQELLQRNNEDLLGQTGEMLDGVYLEIQRVVSHISIDQRINRFQDIDSILETSAMGQAIEYISTDSLYPYTLSSTFISEYYVFIGRSEIIVGPGLVVPAESIYTAKFRFGELEYSSWKELYLNNFVRHRFFPSLYIYSGNSSTEVIPYVNSLGSPHKITGAVLLFVNAGRIRYLLKRIDLGKKGVAGIIDIEGRFIISESHGMDRPSTEADLIRSIDPNLYYTTKLSLGNMGWTYIIVQDRSLITNALAYIRSITLAMIFFVLLVGVFIAFVMGKKQSQPWNDVLTALREGINPDWSPSPVDLVERIGLVVHEKHVLRDRLIESRVQLKDSYIRNLLSGGFNSTEDAQALLEHGGIEIRGIFKSVSIFMFHRNEYGFDAGILNEYEAKRLILHDLLLEQFGENLLLHDLDFDRILLIHSADAHDRDEYRGKFVQQLEPVLRKVNNEYFIHIFSGTSRVCTNIQHLGDAYSEAISAVQQAAERQFTGLYIYSESEKNNEHIRFPIEAEQKLITATIAGNVELAQALFDEAVERNLRSFDPPVYLRQAFLQNLRTTAIRIIEADSNQASESIKYYEALFQLDPGTSNHQAYVEEIRKVIVQTVTERRNRKRSNNHKLISRIKDYLEYHYKDPNLCVSMLSCEFQISEMYFSRFFKEQMGNNFHIYLEELRMSHALQLLRETDQPLKNILRVVGYTSTNTFSRAFRRKFGMSPSTYRNSLQ